MPVLYAVKHVFRSWKLFLALLIGVTLASAFFAGIDIKAGATTKQALNQQLENIYVDMQASLFNLNVTQMLTVRNKILEVDNVLDAEVICWFSWVPITIFGENGTVKDYTRVVAIANHSQIYDGWLNKPQGKIGENETFIPEDSPLASKVKIGETIMVNFTLYTSRGETFIPWNLTVEGFASLDDRASAIASGYQYWITSFPETIRPSEDGTSFLIMISLEKTMQKILEEMRKTDSYYSTEQSVLIYLNREALINPWDIGTSINNIEVTKNEIENKLATDLDLYDVSIQNNLEWPLRSFQFVSLTLRLAFTLVSLPIFFMAWYMGTTVSDVSFNLRRREIGLLLTKGFSRSQILRIFLAETLLIGCIGGILGVFLGFLLNPLFTQFNTDNLFNLNLISPYTLAFTTVFGVIIAFLSTSFLREGLHNFQQ